MRVNRVKGRGRNSTYSVEFAGDGQRWHAKARPFSSRQQQIDELVRMKWAQSRLPVPESAYIRTLPGVSLLISKSLEGTPSYQQIDVLKPQDIIKGISSAIRAIQGVDIGQFPFPSPSWMNDQEVALNINNLARSKTKHEELHPDFAQRTLAELKEIIDAKPDVGDRVLAHGDLCMPNVLLNSKGRLSGIVDLGALHVGDSKLDLAIASWIVEANMGKKWATQLLDLYKVQESDSGILYNRLAYDLGLQQRSPWEWTKTSKLAQQRERLSAEGAGND